MSLIRTLPLLLGVLVAPVFAPAFLEPIEAPAFLQEKGRDPLLDEEGTGPFTFAASASQQAAEHGYAVYALASEGGAEPVRLRLNGSIVASVPVRNGQAAFWRLPELQGANTLEVLDANGQPVAADAVRVFRLIDTFEEVHFGHAFGGRPRRTREAPPKHPSQDLFDVQHYEIKLNVSLASRFLSGSVVVQALAVEDGLTQVALDFDGDGTMTVSQVLELGTSTPLAFTVDEPNDRLLITLANTANTGNPVDFEVFYSGAPGTSNGAFGLRSYDVTTQPNGKPVAWTFSEPYSARSWWPCKDLPDDKATVDLKLTVVDPNIAVSNGTLVSVTPTGGGSSEYFWQHEYPVSTYLIAFCATEYISNFVTYTGLDGTANMPVGHYVFQTSNDELAAAAQTLEVMEHFAESFGEYPFLEEKYVTMTWGGGFGMEHQTATSINNRDLRPANGGGESRRNVHELAHQWFGDMVTPVTFDHLWLNEGFATWAEAYYNELTEGPASYRASIQGFINNGINNTTPIVNSNADAFVSSLVYRKGGVVLHMLRGVVGDTAFFQAIRNYLMDHAYGLVETADLQAAMEAEYGESLQWFFDEWVYGIGRPNYHWDWLQVDDELVVVIEQQQTGGFFHMPIPIRVENSQGATLDFRLENGDESETYRLQLPAGFTVADVDFDPDLWIYKDVTEGLPVFTAPTPLLAAVMASGPSSIQILYARGTGEQGDLEVEIADQFNPWTVLTREFYPNTVAVEFVTANDLPASQTLYVRARALASSELGVASNWTDTYAVRLGCDVTSGTRSLIVDGYDRWDTQNRGPNHPFVAYHAEALERVDVAFDSIANEIFTIPEFLTAGNYEAIFWVAGEESTATQTFSTAERTTMSAYLDGGGQLFLSGAEIGWDLDQQGNTAERAFFNNYLKADYVADDSEDYTVSGIPDSLFAGMNFPFDDGTAGIYFPEWPDVYNPAGGGLATLEYNPGNIAGVQFEGLFPAGTEPGRLVHLGFPFETITTLLTRRQVMERVVDYFELTPTGCPPDTTGVDGWWAFY